MGRKIHVSLPVAVVAILAFVFSLGTPTVACSQTDVQMLNQDEQEQQTTAKEDKKEGEKKEGEQPELPKIEFEVEVEAQADRSESTTVLTQHSLKGEYAQNLNDFLLIGIPGVSTSRRTNFGFSGPGAGFTIRGLTNPHVLVAVDGVPSQVNNHFHARTDQYSPDLIDRLEIIRGPNTVQYGPSAVGGVINIFTRTPSKGFTGFVQAEAGQLNTREELGDIGYGWDGGSALFSFTDRESDASEELGEHFIEQNINLKFRQKVAENWNAGFRFNWTHEPASDQFGSDPNQVFFRFTQDINTYVISFDRKTNASNSLFAVHLNRLDTGSFRETRAPGVFNAVENQENENGFLAKHTWTFGDINNLTAGVNVVQYTAETPKGSTKRDEVYGSPYVHVTRALGANTTLNGGIRFTGSSQFGSDVSPEIGVIHRFDPTLSIRARGGHAFRVPRLGEVFAPIINEDLEPEDFYHAEVGFNKLFASRVAVDVAGWYMAGDNLIQRIGSGPSTQNINVGEFDHRGLEASLNIQVVDQVRLFFGGAVLSVEQGGNVPEKTFDIGADVQPGKFRVTVGMRYAADNTNPVLDDYFVGDARFAYEIVNGLTAMLDIINFTDEEYATTTGFAGPIQQIPRTFLGGVRFQWGSR